MQSFVTLYQTKLLQQLNGCNHRFCIHFWPKCQPCAEDSIPLF